MNRRIYLYTIMMVTGLTLLGGCLTSRQDREAMRAERDAVVDSESLMSYLRANNVTVFDNGPYTSAVMKAPGRKFTVMAGGELYTFEFEEARDAIGATHFVRENWADRLNVLKLYRKDTLLVVYLGRDTKVQNHLRQAMGTQVI